MLVHQRVSPSQKNVTSNTGGNFGVHQYLDQAAVERMNAPSAWPSGDDLTLIEVMVLKG